jgi:uncharacterized protein YqeY
MSLVSKLKEAQKDAMRAKDKVKLGAIRMVLSEIQKKEVDERSELSDDAQLAVLTKEVKKRLDAKQQFIDANRSDLADKEAQEILALEEFLPKQLSEDEILELIEQAISNSDAKGMQDMGKVMGVLKPQLVGKADMGKVSALLKSKLA